jgi:hypothetical protein
MLQVLEGLPKMYEALDSRIDEWIKIYIHICTHHGTLLNHKEKMKLCHLQENDGNRAIHVEEYRPSSKSQISHVLAHLWNLHVT